MRRVIRKVFVNKVFDRKVVLITGACAGIGLGIFYADFVGTGGLD